jgi:hypothetical protein
VKIICFKCKKNKGISHWLGCDKFLPKNLGEEIVHDQLIQYFKNSLEDLINQETKKGD